MSSSGRRLLVDGISLSGRSGPLSPLALRLDASVVVLYGRNGTGKTALLDSLRHAAGDPSVSNGGASLHLQFTGDWTHDPASRTFADLLRSQIHDACRRHVELDVALGADDDPDARDVPGLVSLMLRTAGLSPELAQLVATQDCWVLDRDDDNYYLSVGVRLEGDVDRLVTREVEDGPEDGYAPDMHPHIALRRAKRRAREMDWQTSHPILNVRVDDVAVQHAFIRQLVPVSVGLVTEGALESALHVLNAELSKLLQEHPVLVVADTVDADGPVQQALEAVAERASDILSTLLPDAPTVDLSLAAPWSGQQMVTVRVLDRSSAQLVPLDHLSSAERRWTALAVQLAIYTRQLPEGNLLLVLDEPDAGLHPQALRKAARGLCELSERFAGVTVLATHSPEMLSLPDAGLVHVTRAAGGTALRRITAEQLAALDEAGRNELGLSRGDVLLMAGLYLIVEGEHDEALVRTWLAEELAEARAQIFKLRGTHNLSSILDSHVLLPATEAPLLVLIDATRTDLAHEWETVLTAPPVKRGSRLHKARRRLEAKRALTDEERRIWQMFESAVRSDEVERLHLHGFEADDVIEYLPAPRVTGTASDGWPALKREWRDTRDRGQNFKSWLTGRGVDVSTRRLAALAEDLPAPPAFVSLGDRLRAVASRM